MDTASVIANNLPNTNVDLLQQKSALGSIQASQAQGSYNAFKGIDFNDPQSVTNGISNLIKSGNNEGASALAGLAYTQQLRGYTPQVMGLLQKLGKRVGGQNPDITSGSNTPQTQPSTDQTTDQTQTPQQQLTAASAHMQHFSDVASNLIGKSPEESTAILEQLKAQHSDNPNVVKEIENAESFINATPSQQERDKALKDLSDNYASHAAYMNDAASGNATADTQVPATHDAHVPNGNPSDILSDPNYLGLQAYAPIMKAVGMDLQPALDNLRAIAQPWNEQQAQTTYAYQKSLSEAEGKVPAEMQTAAFKKALDNHSEIVSMVPPGGTAPYPINKLDWLNSLNPKSPNYGAYSGYTLEAEPGHKANVVATGTKSGEAPYTTQTVEDDQGHKIPVTVRVDGHGNTIIEPVTKGSGGAPMVGASPTDIKDQDNLVEAISKIPAQQITLEQGADRGRRIVALASNIPTGKYTENVNQLSQYFPGLKSSKEYANNAELLKQDLSGSFKTQLGGLAVPRIASEANAILGTIPKNTSPQDLVKVYGALLTAAADKQRIYNNHITEFKNDPANKPTLSNAQHDWDISSNNKSLYADPVWNNMQIGGKPAVAHVTVGGHNALIILPGLLGKNAIVKRLD